MFKLISAIFTAGVVVGITLVLRQRRLAGNTEQPTETTDHSDNDHSNNESAAEPNEAVNVPAERP